MKSSSLLVVAFACLLAGPAVYAQQASAPAGSTGQCKDGSYSTAAVKKGSCKGHKGVKEWYAAADTAAAAKPAKMTKAAKAAAAAAAAPAAMPAPAAPAMPAAKPAPRAAAANRAAMPAPAANAAPGGGPGMVWVNSSSKVYHCSTDKWYGKTKQGAYMSEADAKAKGNHAEHGKSCTP